MAMGIVSSEDFEREVENSNRGVVLHRPEIIDTPHRGRSKGDNNVPEVLRKIIGEESVINGRAEALALAKMFDVSPSSVSAYANGATSTKSYDKKDSRLEEYIRLRKGRVTKRALVKLTQALDEITPEKLAAVKQRDLAGIAKDMAVVVKNFEPPSVNQPESNSPKFIFYAPNFIKEDHYETIVVNE